MKKEDILRYIAFPLGWIYVLAIIIRNLLFDAGIIHSEKPQTPTIVVGNLTAGGTGKTPHTEYLLRLLSDKFNIAELSRGHKRKSKGYYEANTTSSAYDLGDEALQIHKKFPNVYVAVDKDRLNAIKMLKANHPDIDAIVLDDAFQHRYVKAGISILLCDYNRPYYSDYVLPYGYSRELRKGAERADIIIVSKCPENLTAEEQNKYISKLKPTAKQKVFFTYLRYGTPYKLSDGSLTDLNNKAILATTAIARPEPLVKQLKTQAKSVKLMQFADHHFFTSADYSRIEEELNTIEGDKLIIITEKDAAKIRNSEFLPASLEPYICVQPIEIGFLYGQEQFNKTIYDYVERN